MIPHIVIITNDLKKQGGTQRLIVDQISAFQGEFQFTVILTREGSEFSEELENTDVKIHLMKDIGLLECVKIMNSADIVHGHLFPSSYYSLLTRTVKVHTEHNTRYRRRRYALVRFLEKYLFLLFYKNICISEGVKREVRKVLGYSSDRNLMVVHNGIDVDKFACPDRSEELLEPVRVGMLAKLSGQKDFATLIRTMAILPSKYELVIGGDGAQMQELQSLASSLGVIGRVSFVGEVDDPPGFMRSIDIYVQSSFYEGFGLAAIEAQAAGLPCLGTNVPGLNEIVSKDLLFEASDHEELAEKLVELVESPDRLAEEKDFSVNNSGRYRMQATHAKLREIYHQGMGLS